MANGNTLTLYKQWPKWHPSNAAVATTAARKPHPPHMIHGAESIRVEAVAFGCQRSVRKARLWTIAGSWTRI